MGAVSTVHLFALAAALLWGISPVFTKRGIVRGGTSFHGSLTVVTAGAGCYLVGLAIRGNLEGLLTLSPLAVLLFVLSGVIGASVWLGFFAGVDRVGASIATAGFSTHPLFAAVIALVALGESLSPLTAGGVVILVAGLVLVASSNGGDRSGWTLRDLVFPLSAAAAYAVSNVIRRHGLTATPATPLEAITINVVASLVVLLGYALVTRERQRRPSAASVRAFVASGLLSAVALLSLFEAFARGSVAVVSALSGLSTVVTTAVTAVFLADVERITRAVVTGACLVVCGTALITVG
jgi:DME family drug/metabolite transporter